VQDAFRQREWHAVLENLGDALLNPLCWRVAKHCDVGRDRFVGQVELVGG